MNVIMVAEDINKDGSFKQSKGELLCTVSNLAFIKHYFPTFHTILYVDTFTKQYYESFGITELFDEVNDSLLEQSVDIDKKVFWASGKLLAQRETQAPLLTLDLDFWIFSDISKLGIFDSEISCLWMEELNHDFYADPKDIMKISGLNWKFDWDNYATNVSFLYIKDNEFKNIYCNMAINFMRTMFNKVEWNPNHHENTKYILFAEQYMLNQLVKKYGKDIKVLIDDFYPIDNLKYVKSVGVNLDNCVDYVYHMGNHKEHYRKNNEFAVMGMNKIYDMTNKHIKDERFLNLMNKIYNMSEYEGNFC